MPAGDAVIQRDIECPGCGRPLRVIWTGDAHRCVECGIADFETEGHVAQLWWSEDPTRYALSTGWGGSDIWACSCGARDEDDNTAPFGVQWAQAHATPLADG